MIRRLLLRLLGPAEWDTLMDTLQNLESKVDKIIVDQELIKGGVGRLQTAISDLKAQATPGDVITPEFAAKVDQALQQADSLAATFNDPSAAAAPDSSTDMPPASDPSTDAPAPDDTPSA